MNETEVLRIEGNVTVPKDSLSLFKDAFDILLQKCSGKFSGNIVPQDDETGMRLYRVEEVEGYKTQIDKLFWIINDDKLKAEANDKAFLSLSEELTKERESLRIWQKDYKTLQAYYKENQEKLISRNNTIQTLEKRLELSEQTRWRTFIKWWNNLWERISKKK